MSATGYTLYNTAIGRCGMAWNKKGLTAVQLPEASDEGTIRRLLKNADARSELVTDWPPMAAQAIEGIQALLRGESRDLRELVLDMSQLTEFQRDVYAIARAIPPGQTRTYGEVAVALGDIKLSRAVGQALGRNPFAPVVPCHRVLASGNRPGGFSAKGGVVTKWRMLAIEGAVQSETFPLFD